GARIGRVRIEGRLRRDGWSHAARGVQDEQDVGLDAGTGASGEDLAVIGQGTAAGNGHEQRSSDEARPAGLEYQAHGGALGFFRWGGRRGAVCGGGTYFAAT